MASIQIANEPNLTFMEGSKPYVLQALAEGVVAAKKETRNFNLPIKIGFGSVPDSPMAAPHFWENLAKAGDNKAAEDAEREWYANADEIAALLGSINPYWSEESWKAMLHTHLVLVKAEAVDMLTKDYAAGIAVYDEIESQSLEMADMMFQGIIKPFPNEFID